MESSTLFFWIAKGGAVMWVLLAVSIVIVALTIERIWFILLAQRVASKSYRVLQPLIHRGAWSEVAEYVRSTRGALSSALGNALHEAGLEDIPAAASPPGEEFRSVDRGLWLLGFLGESTPLLGLLGTVLGMIRAFQEIQAAQGAVDPQLLAGGIWEALLTTAFGLIVAIPALGVYHFLNNRVSLIESMAEDLTDHAVRVFTTEAKRRTSAGNGELQ
jgi:biopolymer transport protein ExbB